MADYNGWKNRETWNVALWISNDEGLYRLALEYVRKSALPCYDGFLQYSGLVVLGTETPDGVKFVSDKIDFEELSAMLREME